jgi:cyclophilin family peptidyl-prolyl cis-trans isomerase
MNLRTVGLVLTFCSLIAIGCDSDDATIPPVVPPLDLEKVTHATIHTNYGDITVMFYREVAPKAVRNWIELADRGYYDGVTFHRVIENFMMQGGDPTGTGDGGESIYGAEFEDELDPNFQVVRHGYRRGVMAMANSGPNTNGSQFFIMHVNYNLPRKYTIFGKAIDGLATVDSICTAQTDTTDRPLEEIFMKNITLTIEE